MLLTDEEVEQAVREINIVTVEDMARAKDEAQTVKESLASALIRLDFISEGQLARLIAEKISIPYVALKDIAIPHDILLLIPELVSRKQKIVSFKKDKQGLHVGMLDPRDIGTIEFLKKKTGLPIIPYLATSQDLSNAASQYSRDVIEGFDDSIRKNIEQVSKNASVETNELPIIKIVETILSYAYQNRASDIHIEPQENGSMVRFRVDGVLHDIVNLPLNVHEHIIIRIKVLSGLHIDEHQAAQDGKLQFKAPDEELDVRVSLVPAIHGEKAVLRLLSSRSRQFSLESLGFSKDDLVKMKDAYHKPYGMILSAGPTGSGKTTTMYAILKLLNQRGVNISTIEDPVEYDIAGITQIQANPKAGLTFASGLRSILRQDPNIILVGEIRDDETASIAVNSAMTGHLVLSTIHANDTSTSFPRLFEMGIEPFLASSTVNVVVAQRLVRKIHDNCRASEEIPATTLVKHFGKNAVLKCFGKKEKIRVYRGRGCEVDHNTGYEGRVGIFEIMVMDEKLRKTITEKADAATIQSVAVKSGMKTMLEDGLEKIRDGHTTIEEVLRVVNE